jgi:hypothetical protein
MTMRINVQNGILSTVAELIATNRHFFQCFLDMHLLTLLPPLFQKAPLSLEKHIFDGLVPLIPVWPLYMLRLVNIYTCLHPPMPRFSVAADIRITHLEFDREHRKDDLLNRAGQVNRMSQKTEKNRWDMEASAIEPSIELMPIKFLSKISWQTKSANSKCQG